MTQLHILLDKIISPNQETFVKGRQIAKNTVKAEEMSHCIKSTRGREV